MIQQCLLNLENHLRRNSLLTLQDLMCLEPLLNQYSQLILERLWNLDNH